jgi:hypothetical protein
MNIKHSYEEVKNFYDKDNVVKINKLRQIFLNNNNNKNILINYYNKNFKSDNINVKTNDVNTYNITIANLNNIIFINFNTMAITDYILCKINHKEISLSNKIKKQLNLKINNNKLKVGFIYRNNNRILYDYESKEKYNKNILVHTILNKECKKINIPFESISFDNATFEEQAEFLKDVKILISCHGATLTNLFLLPKNAIIFDISDIDIVSSPESFNVTKNILQLLGINSPSKLIVSYDEFISMYGKKHVTYRIFNINLDTILVMEKINEESN